MTFVNFYTFDPEPGTILSVSYYFPSITYYTIEGADSMARRVHNIKVIIHPLDDVRSLELIQEATNDLYARIIENKLSTVDLSSTEKEYIVRQVIQKLMAPST